MQLQLFFSQSMVLQEVVEHADDCVGPLASVEGLVNKIVHLTRQPLTADPKDGAFSWCFKVDGAWLKRVVGKVYLLGEIEGEMYCLRAHPMSDGRSWRRRREHTIGCVKLVNCILAFLHSCSIV